MEFAPVSALLSSGRKHLMHPVHLVHLEHLEHLIRDC
jgi:hypothetical protein